MKINGKLLRQGLAAVTLKELLWLVLFSLCAGHYMVSHQEAEYFWELWMMGSYYPAMLGSFLIAFCISLVVCYINNCLDQAWPWLPNFFKRLLRQLQFGILLPLCLLPPLLWIYFSLRGAHFDVREYFRVDFGASTILIASLNLVYLCRYLFAQLRLYYQPVEEQFANVEEEPPTEAEPEVDVQSLSEMLYFYHSERVNWGVNCLGEMVATDLTMDELEALLPTAEFLRIQKGFILNKKAVENERKASSHRLLVYLNAPYHKALSFVLVGDVKTNYTLVSQRKVSLYKEWKK